MAATLVGGAFLSATVQTLVEKLASAEFRDYIKNTKLNVSLLTEMKTTLLTLQVVLDDAEEKQINNSAVKQWLDELKDAVFDAEDLLNEISYDSLRCKVENTQAANKTSQVWNFLSSPFKSFYAEINSQMKIMCQRLQLFAQHKDTLGLQTVSRRFSRRAPSSSIVNESVMVGRKDEKERLVNMLLSQRDTGNHNVGVITIFGMGGVGKTTLAQLLYNDKQVQQHFELKAWACVSEDFDILRVTKTLLESITSTTWESSNLDSLRVELKKSSREKRFLFVLDDLWNEDYNDWDELVSPFIDGKSGSRVIITTRQQKVAEVARTFPIHKLEPLSDEDCWSLLSKHALETDYFQGNKYTNLEAIGRKIAIKCAGLPIAAKTLGGLLRSKVDEKEWTAILNSDIWNLPNNNILPALLLSYQYLPSHLKRCFSYCSVFPKDYPLDRKQLVLLWMAQGLLEHSQGKMAAEEIGDDCFAELLSRSLIQKSNDDARGEKFVMHDLVNDLAIVISGKSCCRLECGGKVSESVRHMSYNQEEYDIFKKFESLYEFKCLRSFLPIVFGSKMYLSKKVVNDLLPTLRRLRMLSLSNYRNITTLPDSIGTLVHLRYLDLSRTGIENLPDTTCNLYNLQTLILSQCWKLTELPIHIGKLISLRHLDISHTRIKELPTQIVGLENLRTLTFFVVGKRQVGLSIKEIRKFTHLHGKFTILNLHNIVDTMEAYEADLKSKEHIEELVLQWGKQPEDSQLEKVVLDALQPSLNLKKLGIHSYGGTSFPSWLGDSMFSNMVFLHIENCKYCVTLPPLGQLVSLKDLLVGGMTILETIGSEFYGMEGGGSNSLFQPFSSLQKLTFMNMPNWKEWLPFEGNMLPFPRLITLRLLKCPELRGHLPSHLFSIEELVVEGCGHVLATPPTMHWLSTIKKIDVVGDSHFEGATERTQWSLLGSDSPCQLQSLSINWCNALPKMILSSTCLQHLELCHIPSLTAFPDIGLPTSLCSLEIVACKNLAFLPPETWSNYKSLVNLELRNSCHALTSFPLDGFPALKKLQIRECDSLESIFISESCSSIRPSTLQSLTIESCNALRSLPQQMNTFTALERLKISCCNALRSLPQCMDTLTALERLDIYRCNALRSLPQRMDTLTALEGLFLGNLPELELSFSEGTFLPSKLRYLHIHSVGRTTTPVTKWGLQSLTALSSLQIEGNDNIVKTVLKEPLLPVSLLNLTISYTNETKSLEGNGLRHLSSLKRLHFFYCSVLESFSEDMLPSSLVELVFWGCARLESLPEDTLPSSLKLLEIWKCPLLEARYGSQSGEHWSKISHIPVIKINDEVII